MKNEALIRVMLVDDEYLALEDLRNMIDWRKNNCEIVSTAQDGDEAFKQFKRFKPDVVITDVRMPVMDGIELASKIREISDGIVIIFLTAFEEFDYVKRALKLNADDYLIKHEIDQDLLEKTMQRVQRKIISNRNYSLNAFSNYLEAVFEHKEEAFQLTEMQEKLFGECMREPYLFVVLQEYTPLPVMKHFVDADWPEYASSEKVIRVCNEHSFGEAKTLRTACLREGRYLISIKAGSKHSQMNIARLLNDFCRSLTVTLSEFAGPNFSAFYFCAEMVVKDAWKSYAKYSDRLYLTYIRESAVFDIMDPGSRISQNSLQISKSEISEAVKNGDFKQICMIIDQAEKEIAEHSNYPGLAVMVIMLIEALKGCTEEMLKEDNLLQFNRSDINRWYNAREISEWLKEKFAALILKSQEKTKYSKAVQRALEHIYQNYSKKELSLDSIAIAVILKPSRLGCIFKKETDKTVIEYLTWYRIEKAKELLDKGICKVYEVSEKVGFSSSEYFSKVFKKITGVSPYDYKRGT